LNHTKLPETMKSKSIRINTSNGKPHQITKSTIISTHRTHIASVLMCALLAYAYVNHLETLFDNSTNFSHLSTLERELSFRTECALYYYYFKTLVTHQNVSVLSLLDDQRTEYPTTINALQRFNLYAEVALASVYKLANRLNLLQQECYTVTRDSIMPPVQSCTGTKVPIYFYSKAVFVLHASVVIVLFLYGSLMAKSSVFGGLIATASFIFNHGEATRVMWTPALRESFSFPFHLLQVYLVTLICKTKVQTNALAIGLTLTTLVNMVTWQFSQFSVCTQTLALYATYLLGYMSRQKFTFFVKCHTVSLVLCFALMFANRMLLASFFASVLLSIWLVLFVDSTVVGRRLHFANKLVDLCIRVALLACLTICMKKVCLPIVFQVDDDSHIWDILRSKIMSLLGVDFHTFDTRLYTCAKEFDFLEMLTVQDLTRTLLVPVCLVNQITCALRLVRRRFGSETNSLDDNDDAYIVYTCIQLLAYTSMALLIMRLKLLWTPYLCVYAALFINDDFGILQYFKRLRERNYARPAIAILLILAMSHVGIQNIKIQYGMYGEFSDYPKENLVKWIRKNTNLSSALACSMPLCANLKLSTNRPIVVHPHYEDVDLRNRVNLLYTHLYGFKRVDSLHRLLKQTYKANYLIMETHYCLSHPPGKSQCAMKNIAHIDQATSKETTEQACQLITSQSNDVQRLFVKKFKYNNIIVFEIK
jgi:hypothetical protein